MFGGVDAAKNEKDLYGLRYGQFVVPLVKAVQDLSAQTQELVTKIENQQKLIELLLAKDDSQTTLGEANSTGAVLYPNNPNPFSVDTEIKMKLPETVNHAALSIYSIGGLQLKSVPVQERGEVSIKISANELNSGIYIYSLVIDGKVIDSQRMILTK